MRVAITNETMRIGDAPIGLLKVEDSGEYLVKTEYYTHGRCDCYIVSSGEKFHGKGDEELVRALVIIE